MAVATIGVRISRPTFALVRAEDVPAAIRPQGARWCGVGSATMQIGSRPPETYRVAPLWTEASLTGWRLLLARAAICLMRWPSAAGVLFRLTGVTWNYRPSTETVGA